MKEADLIIAFAVIFTVCSSLVAGQCDQRDRAGPLTCCFGRNSTCAVERYDINSNDGRPRRKVCFCDAFCELAGDCCPDFERVKKECKIQVYEQECVVSTWSRWTPCSQECGLGRQKRHRDVIVKPSRNLGKTCPPLRQKRGCYLKHCGEAAGMARILPRQFKRIPSRYEKIIPVKTQQLFKKEKKKRPSYCAHFKVESKHPYCQGTWAKNLDLVKPVCVECQDSVMDKKGHCKGHGVLAELTSWDAVDIYSCHGEWRRISPRIPNCQCDDEENFNNFIFV